MNENDTDRPSAGDIGRRAGRDAGQVVVWVAGLVVALAAAVATAHGLYEVAVAATVDKRVAALYPVITDGLAITAYVATTRLVGRSRVYAWVVVVLAAGLSGIAQAAFLAGGVDAGGSTPLRAGVGAWPAVAAALAAHLLFLLGHTRRGLSGHPAGQIAFGATTEGVGQTASGGIERATAADVQAPGVQATGVQVFSRTSVQADPSRTTQPELNGPGVPPAAYTAPPVAPLEAVRSPIERATDAARAHQAATGVWPSVRELHERAGVGHGTAAKALKDLRERPDRLQLVTEQPSDPETGAHP